MTLRTLTLRTLAVLCFATIAAPAAPLAQSSNEDVQFVAHEIDTGRCGGHQIVVADLNADKRAVIVCVGTATADLKWHENKGTR